jgi:hypothetical protein
MGRSHLFPIFIAAILTSNLGYELVETDYPLPITDYPLPIGYFGKKWDTARGDDDFLE